MNIAKLLTTEIASICQQFTRELDSSCLCQTSFIPANLKAEINLWILFFIFLLWIKPNHISFKRYMYFLLMKCRVFYYCWSFFFFKDLSELCYIKKIAFLDAMEATDSSPVCYLSSDKKQSMFSALKCCSSLIYSSVYASVWNVTLKFFSLKAF